MSITSFGPFVFHPQILGRISPIADISDYLQCDGYSVHGGAPNASRAESEPTLALSHHRNGDVSIFSKSSDMVLLSDPSLSGLADNERRAFDFFRSRTSTQLPGFFASDIWDRSILQATFHEPAIRHAVLALGCLHEVFERSDKYILKQNVGCKFALEQYNLAITHLVKPAMKGQQAIDVCLIACMLFCCFEVSDY